MLKAQCLMLNAQCSILNAQRSTLNAQRSTLNAQCSTLNAQCSMLNAQHSMLNTQHSMLDAIKTDSILFDMDGTLWDGVETYANGFNDFFEASSIHRKLTANDLYAYMGLEEEQYLDATLSDFPVSERKEAYQHIINFQYKRIQSDGGILYEGVKDGLKRLAEKYQLFIVSNCPEFTIQYFMEWAGIKDSITDTIAHGMNFKSKYENMKLLIEKYNLQNPVYVGDTESDRIQSELVPIPFVYVDYGFGKVEKYVLRFNSFKQLTDYFIEYK
jgi:phosphoglycolate phosphatase